MKSKATTYLLVAGVVIIWGIILWKMFSPVKDTTPVAATSKKTESVETRRDTLILNYRDPFLGSFPKVDKTPKRVAAATAVVHQEPEQVQHNLRYLGMITKDKVNYGLIEINGLLYTLKAGESADGYKVEKVFDGSVVVRWKGNAITVAAGN